MTTRTKLLKRFLLEHYAITSRDKGIMITVHRRNIAKEERFAIVNDVLPGTIDCIWIIKNRLIGIRLFDSESLYNSKQKKFDENFLKQTNLIGEVVNLPESRFESFLKNYLKNLKDDKKEIQ